MARTFIVFSEEEPNVGGTTIRSRLDNAWVYWKEGSNFQVLRVNGKGQVFAFTDGNRERRDGYRTRFATESGTDVDVAYSLGAKPLARTLVDPMLTRRKVPSSLIDLDDGITASEDGVVNARRAKLGEVRLPRVRIGITTPAREPSLIVALWENLSDPDDAYYTRGIPQQAGWFAQPNPPEHQAAAAAPAAVRPRVRGIPTAGFVPEAATGANLKLRDAAGNPIQLLQNGHDPAGPRIEALPLTLQAAQNKQRAFTATLFLPPDAALGPVQILIEPTGLPTPMVGGFFYQLVGAQLAIVDDFETNPSGAQPGPERAAANEVNVVDYLNSPEMLAGDTPANRTAVRNALTTHVRARRMVRYAIRNHHPKTVPFAAVAQPAMAAGQGQVLASQMPFWMAELQLVGLNRAQLEDLLQRDLTAPTPGTGRLELQIDWGIAISWDTPDRADPQNPIIQPRHRINQAQTVTLKLAPGQNDFARGLENAQSGVVTGAIQPAPQQIPFPVAGRRLPAVRVAEAGAALTRTWGRHGGAARDALVVEWQPIYSSDGTVNGAPFFRGGDGLLSVRSINVNGQPVEPGLVFPRPTPAPPPAPVAGPAGLELPRFRVHGINLTEAQVGDMVEVITEQTYRANIAASPWIGFVSLDVWKATARSIIGHETDSHQFADGGLQVGRIRIPLNRGGTVLFCHGKERDMPTFGAPHGYGVGQLDPPGNIDRLWDLEANVIESVRRLLIASGSRAVNDLNLGNNAAALTRKERAVFHRATVRRYNGGREFIRNAANTDWVIRPSIRFEPNIYYPNDVLGTGIAYHHLIAAPNREEPAPANRPPLATQLDFPPAEFFPGI